MKKQLSEMSLEELWELFPIILKEHNSQYKNWYETEKQIIINNIEAGNIIRINHIGSSAVEGLVAKPTVDILLEIDGCCNLAQLIENLKAIGWGLMLRENDPMKMTFNKGYTPDGFAEKVYHLHVRYFGDWDELYFRDFLIAHPDIADEYGKLKLSLLKEFEHNRDGYTEAKSEFIMMYSKIAKKQLKNKYKPNWQKSFCRKTDINMEFLKKGSDILLKTPDFDLDQTLDCGQAFRWERENNSSHCTYNGYMLNTPLRISAVSDYFILHDTSEKAFLDVWADYFDLYTDYSALKEVFSQDETLSKACSYAWGIRLLKQDKWEALCSFIISQNNNIPRIKGIINRLCSENGGFPGYNILEGKMADDFSYLRAGFRAKYITDCIEKLNCGTLNLEVISQMPVQDARKALITIKGVGPKVAECALLYGMYRTECFPVDVWIKRVLEKYYPNGLPDYVKEHAGIAQQYLFHYMRTSEKC